MSSGAASAQTGSPALKATAAPPKIAATIRATYQLLDARQHGVTLDRLLDRSIGWRKKKASVIDDGGLFKLIA